MIKQDFHKVICDVFPDSRGVSEYKYGWRCKSLGFKNVKSCEWIKLVPHESLEDARNYNKKIEESVNFEGVNKPRVNNSGIHELHNKFWSIITMDYISNVLSPTPYLNFKSVLPGMAWFSNLKASLSNLELSATSCIAFRQELITRRIQERFPAAQTTITDWKTAHGDLHWANLASDCTIIDWESWGRGPKGIDIAFLFVFSILHNEAQERLKSTFSTYFNDTQFNICLLFACCELMRMTEIYSDHPDLYEPLYSLSRNTYKSLKQ